MRHIYNNLTCLTFREQLALIKSQISWNYIILKVQNLVYDNFGVPIINSNYVKYHNFGNDYDLRFFVEYWVEYLKYSITDMSLYILYSKLQRMGRINFNYKSIHISI